jgi:hypothetical protein
MYCVRARKTKLMARAVELDDDNKIIESMSYGTKTATVAAIIAGLAAFILLLMLLATVLASINNVAPTITH